ncbi:hypothetical protein TNCV_3598811 [Trichonephila clavipes]|nr:hypothetical protein TNCV_3598811 [Trichonephila clavipes]
MRVVFLSFQEPVVREPPLGSLPCNNLELLANDRLSQVRMQQPVSLKSPYPLLHKRFQIWNLRPHAQRYYHILVCHEVFFIYVTAITYRICIEVIKLIAEIIRVVDVVCEGGDGVRSQRSFQAISLFALSRGSTSFFSSYIRFVFGVGVPRAVRDCLGDVQDKTAKYFKGADVITRGDHIHKRSRLTAVWRETSHRRGPLCVILTSQIPKTLNTSPWLPAHG